MALDVNAAPSVAAAQSWRVTLDSADASFSLRDYFRRLGVSSEVRGPTVVALETDLSDGEIEEFVASWTKVNGISLQLERMVAQPQLLVPPPPATAPPRIGELLVRKGFITEEQLAGALTEARATRDLLGLVLLREKLIFEDELARTLSEQLSLPYISVGRVGVNASVARLLPSHVGMHVAAIPVRRRGQAVQVAFADPTDPQALAEVGEYLPAIEVAVAELSDITMAWRTVAQARG
jgi:type II secretion system (T2SS) protein E